MISDGGRVCVLSIPERNQLHCATCGTSGRIYLGILLVKRDLYHFNDIIVAKTGKFISRESYQSNLDTSTVL